VGFVRGGELKYLTFMLADQLCGIELSSVRELLGYMPFTPTGHVHPALVGEFDLRGQRVSVLDLRVRFGLPLTRTDDTVMIVVEASGQTVAMIVDSVTGLENLPSVSAISAIHRSRIDQRFIASVVTVRDESLHLLSVNEAIVIRPPMPKAA
jgi:purine-binding chemotaxis protein CheW